MTLTLVLLAQASQAIAWTKVVSVAWPIVAAGVGVFASVWATSKVTTERLKTIDSEVDRLRKDAREQRDRLVAAEKEIALTLKAIEVKLGELTTTVMLLLRQKDGER